MEHTSLENWCQAGGLKRKKHINRLLFLSCCLFHLQKSLSTSQSPESTSHHFHHYYPGTHHQMVLNSTLTTNFSTSLSNTHTTARSLIKHKLVASVTSLLKTEWLPLVWRKSRNPIIVDQAPQAKPHTHPTCPALTTTQASSEEDTRSQEAGSQCLAFLSSALSSPHGPLVNLRPTSNPSSLFPPQLPGLTHLSSRLGQQGRRLPECGKRRPEVKGPPGTRMEVKGDGASPPREGGESGGWLATVEGRAPGPMQPLRKALALRSSLPHWVSVLAYVVCRLWSCCPPYLLQFACGSIPYCLEVLPKSPVLEDASSDQDISLYNPYNHLCNPCHFI